MEVAVGVDHWWILGFGVMYLLFLRRRFLYTLPFVRKKSLPKSRRRISINPNITFKSWTGHFASGVFFREDTYLPNSLFCIGAATMPPR
jgi:hypothetical protein